MRIASLLLLLSTSAAAMDPMPGENRFEGLLDMRDRSGGAAIGLTKIDDAYFLQLKPQLSLNLGQVGVGVELPLNLRLWPREGSENDLFGVLRAEDWDDPNEWMRMVRYARLGKKGGKMFLRYGELVAEMGHGSIIGRYLNNIDLNRFRAGGQFDIDSKWGGFETVIGDLDDLFRDTADSKLVGLRTYSRPFTWLAGGKKPPILHRLRVGFSWAADFNAPMAIDANEEGDHLPAVTNARKAVVYGFDTDLQVLNNALVSVTPYADYNRNDIGGWGLHLGVMAVAKMPLILDLRLPVRLEYRRFSNNYLPTHFGTFYELERYAFPAGSDGGATKWAHLMAQDGEEGLNGLYGEAAFDFLKLVQIGAIYEAYLGQSSNLNVFVNVPALKVLQFKAFYARVNIDGFDDILVFDDRSAAVAQARYQILKGIYLAARASRRWTYEPTTAAFEPTDEWTFGAEYSLSF